MNTESPCACACRARVESSARPAPRPGVHWLAWGLAILIAPKCIACVTAYLVAFLGLAIRATEWCG